MTLTHAFVGSSPASPAIFYLFEKFIISGEVSEWFKELVLKTSDAERHRGFESHPLRHITCLDSSVGRAGD